MKTRPLGQDTLWKHAHGRSENNSEAWCDWPQDIGAVDYHRANFSTDRRVSAEFLLFNHVCRIAEGFVSNKEATLARVVSLVQIRHNRTLSDLMRNDNIAAAAAAAAGVERPRRSRAMSCRKSSSALTVDEAGNAKSHSSRDPRAQGQPSQNSSRVLPPPNLHQRRRDEPDDWMTFEPLAGHCVTLAYRFLDSSFLSE